MLYFAFGPRHRSLARLTCADGQCCFACCLCQLMKTMRSTVLMQTKDFQIVPTTFEGT